MQVKNLDDALNRLIEAFELYLYYIDNQEELNKIFQDKCIIEDYFILLLGYNFKEYYLLDDIYLNSLSKSLQGRKDKKLSFTFQHEKLSSLLNTFLTCRDWNLGQDNNTRLAKTSIWYAVKKWVEVFAFYSKDEDDRRVNEINTPKRSTYVTERTKTYFNKAIKLGYLEETKTGYKSNFQSLALLAYFLELVYCRDDKGKDNGFPFPEKDLNKLFNESRLGKARGQYINNRNGKPKGFEKVDELFH